MLCSLVFKQMTECELRISDWSSDVCSSDLGILIRTLVSIFLVAYFHIAIATALIPNLQIGAIISTIASIIVTAALVTTVVRFQPDNRARYALASLYANGSIDRKSVV